MKITCVLLLALGLVSADIGLGYHYKVPQTSYGTPSYQTGGSSNQYSTAYSGLSGSGAQAQTGHYHNSGVQSSSSLGSGYTGYQSSGVQPSSNFGSSYTGYQNGVSSGQGSGIVYQSTAQPALQYTGSSNFGTGYQSQYKSSNQYQASAVQKYQQYYQVQQQPAQVFKHFYVHAAPEEPEPAKPRTPIVLPPAQKHYKIIFVKTPSESSSTQVIAPVAPQTEEKTIVYVLVKKPEDQQQVVLPKIEQKPPTKPEVYFIKYKNKDDSQAVINNIVQDYNKDGQTVSLVDAGTGTGSYSGVGSGVGSSSYSGVGSGSYSGVGSGVGSGSYSGVGSGSYSSANTGAYTPVVNTVQYSTPVQYATPVQSEVVSSAASGPSYGFSSSSGSGLSSSGQSNSFLTPIVTSTASSLDYDGSTVISTSQGVPHETYGTPKFRIN